ncbi:MAG: aminotransferase class I/II-fold pyridoxal phosphate-dependent enzyme, partial [Candidatus Gastranaerophilales bacterium]|nr:aminotransferase class I/II-fold pyridoxal phosphate-dependent enzyme [Candidatus Gastranaerophilales bacterium]
MHTFETESLNIKFENYNKTQVNEDLFEKTKRLDNVLKTGVLTGFEGLGMITLTKLSSIIELKEKDDYCHDVIMLGTNSYLNIGNHPKVINAAIKALKKYGIGMGAVSNYAGICDLHKKLEEKIAKFYNCEDALVFPSGYGTNVGVISALCSQEDIVINDSANHASIFDGCKLSGAEIKIYPHGNMKCLERILDKIPDEKKSRLIITDGVFS